METQMTRPQLAISLRFTLPWLAGLLCLPAHAAPTRFGSQCTQPQVCQATVEAPALVVAQASKEKSSKDKCLERIRLCQQECGKLWPKMDDTWKGCRTNCGNAGDCK